MKIAVAALAVGMTGCATTPGQGGMNQAFNNTFNNTDPCANNARNTGLVVGALAGALIGAKLGNKDKGAVLAGALIGSAAGGLIGSDIDQRRCELAKVAQQYQLQMSFASVASDGVVVSEAEMNGARNADKIRSSAIGHTVTLQDSSTHGGHFESNSAVLTGRAEQYFSAIADVYNLQKAAAHGQIANAERKLLLVGHTDDTGPSARNADLSERRARAVAEYLERRGIPREQVYYQGAGEIYPVADNHSESGRAQNRRVEIVELSNGENFDKYLEARRPNYQYYRRIPVDSVPVRASAQVAAARTVPVAPRQKPEQEETQRAPRARPGKAPAAIASTSQAHSGSVAASPRTEAPALQTAQLKVVGKALDFGGTPLAQTKLAAAGVGAVQQKRALFSLISSAYASDSPVASECTQDRPRLSGAVKALKDGATYRVNEHVPGLYGKTWTQRVNGHQVVINKVAVLASEASLAQFPELKVYASYDPAGNRNPQPDVSLRPEVNTYLGEGGILYRIFTNGAAGLQCIDILYSRQGGAVAKDGNIVYARNNQLYVSPFKPVIAN